MKCSKCQAEWTPGNVSSQMTNCPFCGASLVSMAAAEKDQTMSDVMVQIVERFGEEILSQESKCLAAFKDFAPKLEKEQKILKIAFSEGVYNFFLGCPVAEREFHMQRARQSMNVLLSDEASLLVVNSFAVALGWNISSAEQGLVSSRDTNNGNNELKQNIKVSEEKSEALDNQEDDEDYLSPYDDPSCASAIVSQKIEQGNQSTEQGNQSVEQGNQLLQKGNEAYEARDYSTALVWYQQAADLGNVDAMLKIGKIYYHGISCVLLSDEEKALYWFRRAANAGSTDAMSWIEWMFQTGRVGTKKKNGCFITTAVCKTLLKTDDCYELTMFRKFRDNWLMMQPDGEALIREYYAVAPAIVQRIDSLPNAKAIYHDILEMYLKPCLQMIEQKNMEGCKKMYMKMVSDMRGVNQCQ